MIFFVLVVWQRLERSSEKSVTNKGQLMVIRFQMTRLIYALANYSTGILGARVHFISAVITSNLHETTFGQN